MKVLVLNGPNRGRLGQRQPEISAWRWSASPAADANTGLLTVLTALLIVPGEASTAPRPC